MPLPLSSGLPLGFDGEERLVPGADLLGAVAVAQVRPQPRGTAGALGGPATGDERPLHDVRRLGPVASSRQRPRAGEDLRRSPQGIVDLHDASRPGRA